MKKRPLLLLPLAAALALAGCSGSDDQQPADQGTAATESAQATASEQPTPTEQATASQQPTASTKTLTGAQVKQIVEDLVGDAKNAQVLDDDMIKAQLGQSEQLMESLKVEPEKCKEVLKETSLLDTGDSIQAAGIIPAERETTMYQVISLASDQIPKLTELLGVKSFRGCDKLVQEVDGQKAEVEMRILDAPDVQAEKVLAIQTTTSSDATPGVMTSSVSVQALDGTEFVSATHTSLLQDGDAAPDVDTELGDLANSINQAFGKIAAIK